MPNRDLPARGLQDQVVYLTGASSGLGAEMARQLARKGARLGLMARRLEVLESLCDEIVQNGGEAVPAACDVGDAASVQQAHKILRSELGEPDCFIANAGISQSVKASRFKAEVAEQVYRTNVLSLLYALEDILPPMLARGSGQIVGISSIAAFTSFPGHHVYSASKAAMKNQLAGLGLELKPKGIDVSVICPGFIRTPLTDRNKFPMPFLMDVEPAVARMIKAIEQRRRLYVFPRRTFALLRLSQLIPAGLLKVPEKKP